MDTVHFSPSGSPLLAAREARRLSQAQAARLVGVSQGAWSRIERGRQVPSMRVQLRIESALGVSVATQALWRRHLLASAA